MKKIPLQERVSSTILGSAERSAQKSAGLFCRMWIGQEKVPNRLLEKEMRK